MNEANKIIHQLLPGLAANFGQEQVFEFLKSVILRLAVDSWARKEPDSAGRLKRIHRVMG